MARTVRAATTTAIPLQQPHNHHHNKKHCHNFLPCHPNNSKTIVFSPFETWQSMIPKWGGLGVGDHWLTGAGKGTALSLIQSQCLDLSGVQWLPIVVWVDTRWPLFSAMEKWKYKYYSISICLSACPSVTFSSKAVLSPYIAPTFVFIKQLQIDYKTPIRPFGPPCYTSTSYLAHVTVSD